NWENALKENITCNTASPMPPRACPTIASFGPNLGGGNSDPSQCRFRVAKAPTTFTSGGPNVLSGGNLAPGSYNNLTLNSTTINFVAGDYFFNQFTFGTGVTVIFDVTDGDIRIFAKDWFASGANTQ